MIEIHTFGGCASCCSGTLSILLGELADPLDTGDGDGDILIFKA